MATSTTALTPQYVQELLSGPAGTPPVGVKPNFDNPPNLNNFTVITIALCVSFATLAVLNTFDMHVHQIVPNSIYSVWRLWNPTRSFSQVNLCLDLPDTVIIGWVRSIKFWGLFQLKGADRPDWRRHPIWFGYPLWLLYPYMGCPVG